METGSWKLGNGKWRLATGSVIFQFLVSNFRFPVSIATTPWGSAALDFDVVSAYSGYASKPAGGSI